ncbi:MAG TPA: hypothetical protein VEC37_10090 [Bacillota bacterium]|nr:hypothetical protein [Bacillota bacterium]
MFWDKSRLVSLLWAIYMLMLVVFLTIYGINRIYGDDIRIENNQIVYYVTYSGTRGRLWSHFVFELVEKVEVKRNKL